MFIQNKYYLYHKTMALTCLYVGMTLTILGIYHQIWFTTYGGVILVVLGHYYSQWNGWNDGFRYAKEEFGT